MMLETIHLCSHVIHIHMGLSNDLIMDSPENQICLKFK